jgi:methanogenic corrinoid protein MtbC1
LLRGDVELAGSLIQHRYLGGESIAELCDGPLREAMRQVGERWPRDDRAIFLEHRATGLCMRLLGQLRAHVPAVGENAAVALGGAPSNDPFLLPSLMVTNVLADAGFHDINLGPNTPLDVIKASAEESHAALVWLSLTQHQPGRSLPREIERLADQLATRGTPLAIGGQSARRHRLAPAVNLHVFDTLNELSGFARGVLASHASRDRS